MDRKKSITLNLKVDFTDQGELPELEVFAFDGKGELLQTGILEKNKACLTLPKQLAGRKIKLAFGPRTLEGQARPSLSSIEKNGGVIKTHRLNPKDKLVQFDFPTIIFPRWCLCLVKGRLVKRVRLPDGTIAEQPVCHARVHICEVDKLRILIPRLPDPDILRLKDHLLHKIPVPDFPKAPFPPEPFPPEPTPVPPGPGPDPAPYIHVAKRESFQLSHQPMNQFPVSSNALSRIHLLKATNSIATIRNLLLDLSDLVRLFICDLDFIWRFYRKDCLTTVEVDEDGRFSTLIGWDCKDQPDIYLWVEQFREGAWETVYKPSIGCGTHWDYVCGTDLIINIPNADGCGDPTVDIPDGVTQFVMPWAIGHSPIYGNPAGSQPAPTGWVKTDGSIDYHANHNLGILHNAPFAHVLNFIQDDSWFIPNDTLKYYRYSYRRAGSTEWFPITTPLSRSYRTEYSDRLPTRDAYPVGPFTIGGEPGLFEFKPVSPPPQPGEPSSVVAREWLRGNIDEPAARWDTRGPAPAISSTNASDDAGVFEIKIEVFDKNGHKVSPGSSTFQFLVRETDNHNSRLATTAEIVDNSYVFRVLVDNNRVSAALPQPSVNGVQASDNCGFLRYEVGDSAHLEFTAAHPNDRAVFRFVVKRGSHRLAIASTNPPYVETAATSAPTSGASYAKSGDKFQHNFSVSQLVGTCVNAAFASSLTVYGKATNGYHRLEYDTHRLIAFALAVSEDET